MSGTKAGSQKAVATTKQKHGADFFKKIGKIGGQASGTGGFYGNPERASRAGKIGGKLGRRKAITPFCTIEGCDKPHKSRGLCRNHYRVWLYHNVTKKRIHAAINAAQDERDQL